ncbi:hypothetical protein Tco_1464767 [Tanacetum coccineum]
MKVHDNDASKSSQPSWGKICTLVTMSTSRGNTDAYPTQRGPLPPVVFRETDTEKLQPLPEVPGKGKKKVGEEQAAQVLLNLQAPKKKSPTEQYIFQRHTSVPSEPAGHEESSFLYAELGLSGSDTESGQAGPNPDDVAESQPLPTPSVLAGPNLEHSDVEITDPSSQPQPEHMDEGFIATAYPKVQENLKLTDFSYGDQFIDDKPSEANYEKTTADTEAESMVSVTIQQDTSVIPPMTSPVIGPVPRPDSPNVHSPLPTTTTTTSATTTTTLPLPPQPQQGPSDPIIIKRMGELEELIANLVEENQALEARTQSVVMNVGIRLLLGSGGFCTTGASSLLKPNPPLPPSSSTHQGGVVGILSLKIELLSSEPVHLKFQMEECHKLLTDKVDDAILKYNVSKPLPLGGEPGHITIQSDFFFNKDLEYLRYGRRDWQTSLCYLIDEGGFLSRCWLRANWTTILHERFSSEGVPRSAVSNSHMRILSVVRIEVFSLYGYDYMKKIILRRVDLKEYVIVERDFKYMYPSDFEDLYLLNLQGHLNHLSPDDKKVLTTAINLWTRNLVIRQHVEDFQLGIIDSPRAEVSFRDRYGVQMIMRFNEIHKFSDDLWSRKELSRAKAFMFAIPETALKTRHNLLESYGELCWWTDSRRRTTGEQMVYDGYRGKSPPDGGEGWWKGMSGRRGREGKACGGGGGVTEGTWGNVGGVEEKGKDRTGMRNGVRVRGGRNWWSVLDKVSRLVQLRNFKERGWVNFFGKERARPRGAWVDGGEEGYGTGKAGLVRSRWWEGVLCRLWSAWNGSGKDWKWMQEWVCGGGLGAGGWVGKGKYGKGGQGDGTGWTWGDERGNGGVVWSGLGRERVFVGLRVLEGVGEGKKREWGEDGGAGGEDGEGGEEMGELECGELGLEHRFGNGGVGAVAGNLDS